MKTVKIIAALLAALLLTGCSAKLTVGTQDENQPAETAKQVVTVEDIGALVSELQNGHVWMACAESELYSLRIDGSGLTITAYAKQDGSWKQLSTETIGSYLAFDLPGNTAELAVVPGSSVPAWVIVTAAAAVVLAGGTVLIRRRKKAPVKQAEE